MNMSGVGARTTRLLKSSLTTPRRRLAAAAAVLVFVAIAIGQVASLGRSASNVAPVEVALVESVTDPRSPRYVDPEAERLEREDERRQIAALRGERVSPSVAEIERLAWASAAALPDSELEVYLLLSAAEKLLPPQDIGGEAIEILLEVRDAEVERDAEVAAAAYSGYMAELVDSINNDRILRDSLYYEFARKPVTVRTALEQVVHRIDKHNASASAQHEVAEPHADVLLHLAGAFADYPVSTQLRDLVSYDGLPVDVEEGMRRVVTRAAALQERGQSLHELRVLRLVGEMLGTIDIADKVIRRNDRFYDRRIKPFLLTLTRHLNEYDTPDAYIAARQRHRYAMACDDFGGLTKSRWTWRVEDLPAALSSMSHWYAWATDAEWYEDSGLALDAIEFPEGADETRALYEEFRRLARDEPEYFHGDDARHYRAKRPRSEGR